MRGDKPDRLSIEFNLNKVQSRCIGGVKTKEEATFLLSLQLENFIEVLTCFSGDSEVIALGICDTQDQMPYGW